MSRIQILLDQFEFQTGCWPPVSEDKMKNVHLFRYLNYVQTDLTDYSQPGGDAVHCTLSFNLWTFCFPVASVRVGNAALPFSIDFHDRRILHSNITHFVYERTSGYQSSPDFVVDMLSLG
jgi:hypothetical protein